MAADNNRRFPATHAPRHGEVEVPAERVKEWLDSLPVKARERAIMALKNGDAPIEKPEGYPAPFVGGARDKWGLIGWRADGSGAYLDGALLAKPVEAPAEPPVPSGPAPRLVGKPKATSTAPAAPVAATAPAEATRKVLTEADATADKMGSPRPPVLRPKGDSTEAPPPPM